MGHNGGVWEWTSTVLEAHDGFVPSKLYPGCVSSAPSFFYSSIQPYISQQVLDRLFRWAPPSCRTSLLLPASCTPVVLTDRRCCSSAGRTRLPRAWRTAARSGTITSITTRMRGLVPESCMMFDLAMKHWTAEQKTTKIRCEMCMYLYLYACGICFCSVRVTVLVFRTIHEEN